MNRMTFRVSVPLSVALAAGKTEYGATTYQPTEAEVGELSLAEREYAARQVWSSEGLSSPLVLDSAEVSWASVAPAIRRDLAKEQAEKSRQVAEHEADVARALALSPSERRTELGDYSILGRVRRDPRVAPIYEATEREILEERIAAALAIPAENRAYLSNGHGCVVTAIETLVRDWTAREDPRVVAVIEDAHARARALTADYDARQAAKAKAEKDKKESARAELRRFALGIDDLARGAKEGYEVAGAVVQHVADTIDDGTALILREGTPDYDSAEWEERVAPRASALRVRDEVETRVKETALPSCVEVSVSRVSRFRADDESPYRTAIVVVVSSPVTKDRVVVYPAE